MGTWVLGGDLTVSLAEALRGDVESARRRADHAEQLLTSARRFPMLGLVQRTRGVAALAEGHADDAFRQLMRIFDPAGSAYFPNHQLLVMGYLGRGGAAGWLSRRAGPGGGGDGAGGRAEPVPRRC